MNFFGHAAVATWRGAVEPGLVLGAMLPDFASMCGARLAAEQSDHAVAAGVVLHHATDAVFHRAPVVVGLFRDAEDRLRARGCRKGPMRAAAHVGVELLLDGELIADAAARAAYLDGLRAEVAITWRDDDGAARFAALRARLVGHGAPIDLAGGAGVARRIERTLAGRRLLAPDADERAAIAAVMTELAPRIAAATPTVISQIRAGLTAR